MIEKQNTTGIILAGGKSSRMGSDKGFLQFDGSTFVQRISTALQPLVNEIIIVSNDPDYDVLGYKRVPDLIEDAGPLAGLYTGLHHSKTEFNLVLSCDIPLIKTAALQLLIAEMDDDTEVVLIESGGKKMPLIALYRKCCSTICFRLLEQGERRMLTAVDAMKKKTLVLDKQLHYCTKNINTPSELKEITDVIDN